MLAAIKIGLLLAVCLLLFCSILINRKTTVIITVKNMKSKKEPLVLLEELELDDPLFMGDITLNDLTYIHIPKTGGTTIEELSKKLTHKMGRFNPTFRNKVGLKRNLKGLTVKEKKQTIRCSHWHVPLWRKIEEAENHKVEPWARDWLKRKRFAVVRDPVSKLISDYNWQIASHWGRRLLMAHSSFITSTSKIKPFCNTKLMNEIIYNTIRFATTKVINYIDCHYIPQVDYLVDKNGRQQVDYIIKIEDLDHYLIMLFNQAGAGITKSDIKALNRGDQKNAKCTATADQLSDKTLKLIRETYHDDFTRLDYPLPVLKGEKDV